MVEGEASRRSCSSSTSSSALCRVLIFIVTVNLSKLAQIIAGPCIFLICGVEERQETEKRV